FEVLTTFLTSGFCRLLGPVINESNHMIEGHGDDGYRFGNVIRYNFSSNVHYEGVAPGLVEHLTRSYHLIENYPSPDARELTDLAGALFNVPPSQLLFTNGATEAFYLVAQLFSGKSGLVAIPSFSEYEDALRIHHVDIRFIPIDQVLTGDIQEDVVFIGNPNNPDGNVFSIEEIEKLLTGHPKSVFVIDEAYIEFTVATQSSILLLSTHANLIIVRSLTKTFVIPGLRLGYLVSQAESIQKISELKMPWSVNTMAIQAGIFILKHYEKLLFKKEELIRQTYEFQKKLGPFQWLVPASSNTHYFLVRLNKGKTSDLKNFLIHEHGILIRDATNFRGLEGEYFRLALQKDEAIDALIQAFNAWENQKY
ncbi:MAG: aminotransferase class I/II-fold pyridoxal phosphate-dependent enzyme, partial [Bacteroidota bacterium]